MRKIKIGDCEYGITSCGRIYSFQSKRFMKTRLNNNGYERVNLNGTDKLIHRLVAEAYIDNPDNLPEVNHKDKNRTNNSINNLEWCTRQENVEYSSNKAVRCVETGVIYKNFVEAAQAVNRNKSGISACIRGKQKTCGGYHWEVITDE